MKGRRAKVFVLLAALVLAALAVAYWAYEQTLGYSPPPMQPLSPVQIQTARVEIRQAEQQVKQAHRAARAGQRPKLDLEVHEEAMSTLLNQRLADRLAKAGVFEPRLHILPGNVVDVGAWIQRDGGRVWVSARLQIGTSMDKLVINPLDVRLGNMPMPESMKNSIWERYKPRLDALNLGLNGHPIQVQSSQGVLRIVTVQ